jgi:hypothetical protein
MKSSIHLFYGIIIGILAMFCVGQKQEDKKEFEEEKIVYLSAVQNNDTGARSANKKIQKLKDDGWTIISVEMIPSGSLHEDLSKVQRNFLTCFVHVGK